MSLDVYLKTEDEYVFSYNITHNLNKMAEAAGIYYTMWRPEELHYEKAGDLIPDLRAGLLNLIDNKKELEKLNPENGWGSYEGLVKFCVAYLTKCVEYPEAIIEVSR